MPRKSKGPWRRKSGGWWVWFGGRQIRLGESRDAAWRAWHLLQAGEPIYDGPTAFRQVADDYVKHLERTRSPRHAKDARERLDAFVQPWWNRAAASLRWGDVENVLATKRWNPTTQGGRLIALRGCLNWAYKTRLLDTNPIPHIPIPRAVSKQNALTKEQVTALLANAGLVGDLLWALSVTGARPGELIGATVDQCDDDGTAIRLRESKVGKRIIWFPKDCRERMAAIKARHKSGPLFPAAKGGHWSRGKFFESVRLARKKAGLPSWVTAYSLRHTFATDRLRGERKLSHEDVATLMGTSVAMLEKTYRHLIDDDVKEIADRL